MDIGIWTLCFEHSPLLPPQLPKYESSESSDEDHDDIEAKEPTKSYTSEWKDSEWEI